MSDQWSIEVLNETVASEINELPVDVKARLVHIVELVEEHGLKAVPEKHVKHLEKKLWEFRVKGKDTIGRAVYVTTKGKRVVILVAFEKKSQKTPNHILKLARKRAKEVL